MGDTEPPKIIIEIVQESAYREYFVDLDLWIFNIQNTCLTKGAAIPPNRPAIEHRPSPVVLTTVGYISTV